ncbi:MAG: trypsin-like peptidase domain-containing protein [Gammaproteobacteria bacterium]|nr:trypsin-like peptidase domain-containing protein [Gammaproteobacteria bacterium]
MPLVLVRLVGFALICAVTSVSQAQQSKNAQQLFEQLRDQVYQVRVIDTASGDKYSLGSGFQITASGLVATNFHVVSSYVHDQRKYRLELVQKDGETIDVELKAIDVINDLAILQSNEPGRAYMTLGSASLKQGDRIFSMGNPHDLGMTIVEGTYNGLVQHVRHGQILFSGSLNPGMSGGPALDPQGRVIGINVSKGGDDISFLVPVDKLQVLMQRASADADADVDYAERIRQALYDDQQVFFQAILSREFETDQLGDALLPARLTPNLRCWGHTEDEAEVYFVGTHQHCQSEDSIYISNHLYTGRITSDYEWITTERLNPFQFYQAVSTRFEHRNPYSSDDEKEVSNFTCHQDTVSNGGQRWKLSSCFRRYQKYDGLYDASLVMVTLDSSHEALLVKYSASGISKQNAISLFKRVMESIEWKR